MFSDEPGFNQPLNWDTRNVIRMEAMFHNATSFNQPLNFKTQNVTNMEGMFHNATSFNQPLNFDTLNVTLVQLCSTLYFVWFDIVKLCCTRQLNGSRIELHGHRL